MAKKNVTVEVHEFVVFPEVGFFADEKAFKKHIKDTSDADIKAWVDSLGIEVKDYNSAPINRMRQIMAIKELHFPSPPRAAKKQSPYAKWTTEELVQMAVDASLIFETTDDPKIMRMRTIMALRVNGIID
jgi:hypothetical protein